MLRSMYSGISGMRNFQTKLDVIGNNISNVNTFGYKKGRVTFKDLMSQTVAGASTPTANRGGTNPQQVGLGATMGSIDTITTQGSLQTTGRQLDLAVNGDGYFTVKNGNQSLYTRAGNFYLDREGSLVTSEGYKVQGFATENGVVTNRLQDIKIDTSTFMAPKATENVMFSGNLFAGAASGETTSADFTVKDSLGFDHEVTVTYEKTANPNEWTYSYALKSGNGTITAPNGGTITFNTNGSVNAGQMGNLEVTGLPNGVAPINMNIDLSTVTQVNTANTVALRDRDGNSEGYLESFNISASGEVVGVFTNGEVNVLSQIALATFSNTSGLVKAGGNMYQPSNNSGEALMSVPGQGSGAIQSAALEMSNVDLSEEFTEMITAQRGFQANTRIITTSDEILQELVNLKR
ncbi:flagellar hook protein FlgE [Bacillus suaedaesalsae]|uniref:Flagellar hook protein FlgE n=1 Tax=Bacillus suaedaesalsae TaxID=2810349 RepID=A0ABS2DIW1_9BACI|nr:flagellar hook protein FlgE [Bacillus suaedaesalsae]MBM6618439.1 flagellar hook protein FlgE [Bacillus suaedaesalsae]